MTAYLTGNWELTNGTTQETGLLLGIRHYRDVIDNSSNVRVTNYNNAWATDGSEIGRYVNYEASATPGSYGVSLFGSIYSGTLDYAPSGLPTLPTGPYYPTVVMNSSGGWKYQPFQSGFPSAFALNSTSLNAGYPTDVKIEVTVRSQSGAFTYLRATILDIQWDTRWNTLYLEETIGDGLARSGSMVINRRTVATVGFATTYNAWWRTAYFRPGASQVPGIGGYRIDRSVGAGIYWLSDLIQNNLAYTTDAYLHTTPIYQPHYSIQ